MGVGGAVAGGFLMRSAGFGGYGGAIVTTMVALIGAVLLTVLTALPERQKALRAATLNVT